MHNVKPSRTTAAIFLLALFAAPAVSLAAEEPGPRTGRQELDQTGDRQEQHSTVPSSILVMSPLLLSPFLLSY